MSDSMRGELESGGEKFELLLKINRGPRVPVECSVPPDTFRAVVTRCLPELHKAVIAKDLQRVKDLLAGGVNVDEEDWTHTTALTTAGYLDLPEIEEALLFAGADASRKVPSEECG